MRPCLAGVGTAVPELKVSQSQALELARPYGPRTADQERIQRILYRRTGIRSRASVTLVGPAGAPRPGPLFPPPVGPDDPGPGTGPRLRLYEEAAPELAAAAARNALADAGVDPTAVDHLIVVTCTGFLAPGIDVHLVRELGLKPTVSRMQVGFMGCHGAFIGLRHAAALAAAAPSAVVLVVAVELCSLHFQYGWQPEQAVANALFADGAAAAVVSGAEATGASGPRLRGSGSWLAAESEDAMTWRIGDHGFVMTLSAQVPNVIRERLAGQIDPWLAAYGLGREDVGSWAVHPGGPRILTAAAQAIGLEEGSLAASREVLATHGNMSSPTILFVLERLRSTNAPLPWVALAFGPGLTTEAALLE